MLHGINRSDTERHIDVEELVWPNAKVPMPSVPLTRLLSGRRYESDTEGQAEEKEVVRPDFPPARLALAPAFPAALGDELGVQLLEVWGFLRSFPEARPPTPHAGLSGPRAHTHVPRILAATGQRAGLAAAGSCVASCAPSPVGAPPHVGVQRQKGWVLCFA